MLKVGARVLLSKYTDAIDLNSLLYLLEQSRHHRIFLFILVSCVNHLAHNHFKEYSDYCSTRSNVSLSEERSCWCRGIFPKSLSSHHWHTHRLSVPVTVLVHEFHFNHKAEPLSWLISTTPKSPPSLSFNNHVVFITGTGATSLGAIATSGFIAKRSLCHHRIPQRKGAL
jgi:hypothetical protein